MGSAISNTNKWSTDLFSQWVGQTHRANPRREFLVYNSLCRLLYHSLCEVKSAMLLIARVFTNKLNTY
eukprot:6180642-Amphidinium_carterae.1